MEKICKNCRWWEISNFNEYWSCYGECTNSNVICGKMEKIKGGNQASVAVDVIGCNSDYETESWLITGPNFGCIHWEEK